MEDLPPVREVCRELGSCQTQPALARTTHLPQSPRKLGRMWASAGCCEEASGEQG